MTYDDAIKRVIHIESEDDLADTPFTYYLDADIGDTVFVCEDADVYMREDKNGWAIYWHNNLMDKIDASDEDDRNAYIVKYRKAKEKYIKVCNAALDGTLEKECLCGDENGRPSFDYSNAAEVFKQFGESVDTKNQLFESLLQEKVGKTIKTPYGNMQVVDEFVIEDDDKLAFVEKAEAKYKELDKEGWFSLENTEPYWYAFPYNRAKFTLCANKNNKVCFIDWRKADYDFLFENKESFFDKVLNEANIEVFPQNGKLQARNIGQQVVSSKTHDKTSGLGVKDVSQPLTRTQLDGTKAVIAYLKSQNKLNDISTQFDTDPHPDITFNGAGDAIITPDGGKGRPYTIPAEKLEPFYESKTALFDKLLEE